MQTDEKKKQWIKQMKAQFVSHFDYLAQQVQNDVLKSLQIIVNNPTKQDLQKLSRQGLLQQVPLLRSHVWKLLLQTLPLDPEKWQQTKLHNMILYKSLVEKFLGSYLDQVDLLDIGGCSNQNFDQNLWGEIQLDTKRTHSTLNFFQKQISHTKMYLSKQTKNHQIMSRILYIWGKINPTVRYVQGMNQILAPVYYLQFQKATKFSESQVFFMFSSVMSFVIDMHIKQMDESCQGIMGKMRKLNQFIKVIDFQLWEKLDKQAVMPHYYSFRWLALLLAQEFGLCETMTLWDVILSYQGYKRFFYLYCACVAILKLKKSQIMQGDFITILSMIQKLKNTDIHQLIKLSNRIYEKYSKVNIEKIAKKIDQQRKIQKTEKQKTVQNETKGKYWNYGSLVKNTTNFLYKLMPRNELKNQKKH